ncbi:hypothetical protein TL16_g02125 [Triparma laevis f. inornata]|uniref:Uncharacterized protein n=1 Tax=Triparma laevis f. inornata TaxID=1714386 RepID=A0A9W7DZG4_9STRA|nr:hypothetical protein TL16_g02125 [Triparma laevis f. inornata]
MAEVTARADENDSASAAVETAVEEKKKAEEAKNLLQKEVSALTRGRDELKSELKKALVVNKNSEAEQNKEMEV